MPGGKVLLIALSALLSLAVLSDGAWGQKSRLTKINERIAKLEKDLTRANKKLGEAQTSLDKRKAKLEKNVATAKTGDFLADMGALLAAAVAKHSGGGAGHTNGHRAEAVFDEIEKTYRKKVGIEIVSATERDLRDVITVLVDEGKDGSDPSRCKRELSEVVRGTLEGEYDELWEQKLRGGAKTQKAYLKAKAKLNDIESELEELRLSKLGNIRGAIPRGMVPVPASEGSHGVSREELQKLSDADRTPIDRNLYLFMNWPPRKKNVGAFLMDTKEVTHLEYWHFCQETGREPLHYFDKKKERIEVWIDGKIPEGWENRPVTYVSYDEAEAYAHWIGARMPSEEEWEVAARSGTNGFDGRFWSHGTAAQSSVSNDNTAHSVRERRMMYQIIPKGVDLPAVLPVGHFKKSRSPLGMHDLNGNVSEWTSSFFSAPKDFKDVRIGEKSLSRSIFEDEARVIRGGHCDQRPLIASSIFRYREFGHARKKYIGFRCARSAAPGLDRLRRLTGGHQLAARLIDFPKTKGDAKLKRDPAIDSSEGRSAVLERLNFNEELKVRSKAEAILIANRLQDEIRSPKQFNSMAEGERDLEDSLLIGVFQTDVAIAEPKLDPGLYFVAYKTGRTYKDEETKEKVVIRDAFLFVPKAADGTIVRYENFGSSAIVVTKSKADSSLSYRSGKDADEIEAIWSFGIKGQKKKSLQVILGMKAEKGSLANFE